MKQDWWIGWDFSECNVERFKVKDTMKQYILFFAIVTKHGGNIWEDQWYWCIYSLKTTV